MSLRITGATRFALVLLSTVAGVVSCRGAETFAGFVPTRQPCRLLASACGARIEVMPGRFVQSYQSFPFAAGDSLVTQAIIVVHGTDRNADDYYSSMSDAAVLSGRLQNTLIIAPRFVTIDDAPAADEPYWTSNGWRVGDLSSSAGPLPRISAYAALDTIMVRLGDRSKFPRLSRIIVAGHSAGAQLLHRFAATSRAQPTLTSLEVRYVAANASTWLYLGPERAAGSGFAVPANASACADYDDWHYGLQNRNTYANALSPALIRQNLTGRDVVIMVGTADTLTADLDVSCGANMQGARRYQRGLIVMDYMNALNPGHSHRLVTVAGVGHSSLEMFTSPDGRRVLFP